MPRQPAWIALSVGSSIDDEIRLEHERRFGEDARQGALRPGQLLAHEEQEREVDPGRAPPAAQFASSTITATPPFMSLRAEPDDPAVLDPAREVALRGNRVEVAGEEHERPPSPLGREQQRLVGRVGERKRHRVGHVGEQHRFTAALGRDVHEVERALRQSVLHPTRLTRSSPDVSVLRIQFLEPRPRESVDSNVDRSNERGSKAWSAQSNKRWLLLGGVFGAGVATVFVSAFTLFAGAGLAASQAKPKATNPPTISGTPQEGKTLTGDRGDWSNSPTDYDYHWLRCGPNGGSCAVIVGAERANVHADVSVDVGNTIRFRVTAKNSDGSSNCDVGTDRGDPEGGGADADTAGDLQRLPGGNPKQVAKMSLPTKLVIDRFESNPRVLTSGTQSFQLRVHVTSTSPCGGDVQGALVYGTATPFNQFTIEEQPTDSTGWASLTFQRLSNFPVNNKQGILAMFLRARKSGENVLGGITGYRLVSVDVNLHQ